MDTKRTIEIEIKGASLTDDEKKKIYEQVSSMIQNKDEKEHKFVDFNKSFYEENKKPNPIKDKIDDFVWSMGVKKDLAKAKWRQIQPETKLAICAIGLPAVTKSVLSIVNEARLVKKEHRLQKESRKKKK